MASEFKGCQCTYDKAGHLVDEGPYMGTYDLKEAKTREHWFTDVVAHYWNNHYTPHLTTAINFREYNDPLQNKLPGGK